MPTPEQIQKAANEYAEAYQEGGQGAVVRSRNGFVSGADWYSQQDQWIPVSERLPDEGAWTMAIVFNNPFFGGMTQERGAARYSHEDKKWYSELTGGRLITIEVHNVTHWQPLPELPKQKQ